MRTLSRKMPQIILLVILLTLFTLAFAACGEDEGDGVQTEDTAVEAEAGQADEEAEEAVVTTAAARTTPPSEPVRLIFIHHSVGEGWLADDGGGLGLTLMENNYFVSDTNYGWGPEDLDLGYENIGDHTDIGHWYNWFAGPNSATYLDALCLESGQYSDYSRMAADPGGENEIVMFKSCYPNSGLGGSPGDPAVTGGNPLRGQDASSEAHTVANAKGIYNDLLDYFSTRQDKLFIVITAPPMVEGDTDPEQATNARAFNDWLVSDWLADYPYDNVAVFDFYDVLTSNGGDPETSDLGAASGNHHRYRDGEIEHITGEGSDYSAYAWEGDSHPTPAGGQKASAEFIDILNLAYAKWKSS